MHLPYLYPNTIPTDRAGWKFARCCEHRVLNTRDHSLSRGQGRSDHTVHQHCCSFLHGEGVVCEEVAACRQLRTCAWSLELLPSFFTSFFSAFRSIVSWVNSWSIAIKLAPNRFDDEWDHQESMSKQSSLQWLTSWNRTESLHLPISLQRGLSRKLKVESCSHVITSSPLSSLPSEHFTVTDVL